MTLGILMTVNAVFALIFALGFLVAPDRLLTAYGATADAELVQMARFFGAAMLGYAMLTWSARDTDPSKARRAIVVSLGLSFVVGFVVALQGQLSGVVSSLGWLTAALYLLFALGYLYYAFAGKEAR